MTVPEGPMEKWLDIKVGESERLVFSTAKAQGKNIYGITVCVQESCLLKAARAFLVYKAVEENVCCPASEDDGSEAARCISKRTYLSLNPHTHIKKSGYGHVYAYHPISERRGVETGGSWVSG